MRIIDKSTDKTLYEGRFQTVRRCLEAAVSDGIDLSGADLRKANLRHARLDGAVMRNACLWGAQLSYADIAAADFSGSDMRATTLKDACLAGSLMIRCDMRGAYLGGAIVAGADFSATQFSCPSMFSIRWNEALSLTGAVYWHLGETPCRLDRPPVVIAGLQKDVVIMDDSVLCGGSLGKRLAGQGESGANAGVLGQF